MSRDREFHRLRVAEVVTEAGDACSVVLDVPPDLAGAFGYRPGQFLTVRVPSDRDGSVARCYSLSSSPHTGDRPTITVKRTDGGYASNWLADNLAAGSMLDTLPPAGTFSPESLDSDFLLFAAGSGITPVISILKSALARGSGRVVLSLRQPGRAVGDLRRRTASAGRRGRRPAGRGALAGLGAGPAHRGGAGRAGPAVRQARDVHLRPGPVPGRGPGRARPAGRAAAAGAHRAVPVAGREPVRGDRGRPGGLAATLEVTLDGEKRVLPWPPGSRMLDVLIESGLDAPYSCRQGICGACACQLTGGEVEMAHNEVLEDEDLAEGYILACQAVPLTESVSITY